MEKIKKKSKNSRKDAKGWYQFVVYLRRSFATRLLSPPLSSSVNFTVITRGLGIPPPLAASAPKSSSFVIHHEP